MKVSVVIRTHNEEKTVGKLFTALKNQTFEDFETILVDNASSDKTLEIAKKYKIDKIINIPEGKFSHPKSLNDGVKAATGDLIVITNGHCLPISTTWLEDGLKIFEDPKVAGISGHPLRGLSQLFWQRIRANYRFQTRILASLTNTNSIIRKKCWQMYEFDESLSGSEDYDWGEEMVARGWKIIKDPKFSVHHYHEVSQETKNYWAKMRKMLEARKRPRNL